MISGRLKMNKQTVIVQGQALMILNVCHLISQSNTVRLFDAHDFVDKIPKCAGFIESLQRELSLCF